MTVEEALYFFDKVPKIKNKIQTLYDVGLGYIKLGQSSTTLSGGEAQRVKLATELSKRATGKTLYILDEPTTGLHIADVHKLVDIIQRLVDTGNTAIVIEHNLDLIKNEDVIKNLFINNCINQNSIDYISKISEYFQNLILEYLKQFIFKSERKNILSSFIIFKKDKNLEKRILENKFVKYTIDNAFNEINKDKNIEFINQIGVNPV